jgi:hypothetical protein
MKSSHTLGGSAVFSLPRVPDEVFARWRELAREVSDALNFAGVSAFLAEEQLNLPGAEIEIDAGDDEAGGVFVNWRPSGQLRESVIEDAKSGDPSTPSLKLYTAIGACMQRAVLGILEESGFDAVPFDDGERPPVVHVLGRKGSVG